MWECTARESADCVEGDLFDPAWRDEDGDAICGPCADELGLKNDDP